MKKRVTLAQVAKRSGYSPTTVSLVLADRPGTRIAEATAEKIRATAAEMGYSADPRARSLRTGRSETLGFISDEVTITRYASAMIAGAVNQAQADGRVVLISESAGHAESRDEALADLLNRRVDGLLVGLMAARRIELPPSAKSVPAIIVNGASDGLSSVLPDEFAAGRAAAQYLIDRGHTSIGLIGRHEDLLDPTRSVSIGRRFAGLDDAMAQAGLSFVAEQHVRDWDPAPGRIAALELLRTTELTAVVTANDRLAFGVYQAATELGLSVPKDLSIMSFDDEQLAEYLDLTTLRLPYEEMGRFAAQWVGQQVSARHQTPEPKNEGEDAGEGEPGANSAGDGRASAKANPEADPEFLIPMPLVERGSVANLHTR